MGLGAVVERIPCVVAARRHSAHVAVDGDSKAAARQELVGKEAPTSGETENPSGDGLAKARATAETSRPLLGAAAHRE